MAHDGFLDDLLPRQSSIIISTTSSSDIGGDKTCSLYNVTTKTVEVMNESGRPSATGILKQLRNGLGWTALLQLAYVLPAATTAG